jgi:hypothetical protein
MPQDFHRKKDTQQKRINAQIYYTFVSWNVLNVNDKSIDKYYNNNNNNNNNNVFNLTSLHVEFKN